MRTGPLLRRFLGLFRPYRREGLVLLGFVLLGLAGSSLAPFLVRRLIDQVFLQHRLPWLPWLCLGLGILALIQGLARYFQNSYYHAICQGVLQDLRLRCFSHLQSLPIAYFDRTDTGQILSRVMSDIGSLEFLLSEVLVYLILDLLMLVGVNLLLLWLHWRLALLCLLAYVPLFLTTRHCSARIREGGRLGREKGAEVTGHWVEALTGVRTIRYFNRQEREAERFGVRLSELSRITLALERLKGASGGIFSLALGAISALVWFYGGREVVSGSLTLGTLVAFNGLVAQVIGPIGRLGRVSLGISGALAAAERVFELLEEGLEPGAAPGPAREKEGLIKPSVKESDLRQHAEAALACRSLREGIRFEGVSFSYTGRERVLDGVSFEIRPYEWVALVGESGAGKSTLVELLLGLYEPQEGRITLDGVDSREMGPRALRELISVMPQEIFLFNASVRDNLLYGRPEATEAEWREAARRACVQEFCATLPQGYDTPVGERGLQLAGGQKQRIALARACLKEAPLLILDEATAYLDSRTEEKVLEGLEELRGKRTLLLISHRLSLLQAADRILVLQGGRIVGSGSHEQLFRENEIYRELYRRQLSRTNGDDGPQPFAVSGRRRNRQIWAARPIGQPPTASREVIRP